ncbi:MAG: polysaccharide biosynthesis protein [Clostridiales bacterium]|nr:polysaccharide biosynthesis protein [Clostridiales bacterium]
MNKERAGKIALYAVCDVLFIEMSILIAMSIWYGGGVPGSSTTQIPEAAWRWWLDYMAFAAPIISLIVFAAFKMYNNLWKYASIDEILKIFLATTIIFVSLYLYDTFVLRPKNIIELSRRFLFIAWLLDTLLFSFSRFGYRAARRFLLVLSHILSSKAGAKRVMIIGAGFSGYGVVNEILSSKIRDRIPAIVLDKDLGKNNTHLMGVRVLNAVDRIVEMTDKFKIDEIVIALPNASKDEMRAIMKQCTQTDCDLKIIPPVSEVNGGGLRPQLRDVSISDLLYRDEIKMETRNIGDYISDRVVMVTGGGGSIGSELCRQIARFSPRLIVVYDIYENTAYELATELESKYPDKELLYVRIGSVLDLDRLSEVFAEFKPNVVFHAAAHKHVHFMQDSPAEAVKNNVFGTLNTARCADKYGVERFVLLSTDKAVNPPNVYGVTKRISEMIVQRMSESSPTKFMTVRFGNVLGSNGSIIPKFKWQIANGGPVTITHPEAERFFMTIPEACQLVLQASGLGKTGRIFVLDMGAPVNIEELARDLIRLSGLRPDKDIEIVYTGLRPGEKLKEELMSAEEKESYQVTCHKKIFVTKPLSIPAKQFDEQLKRLHNACRQSPQKIDDALKLIEPHYSGMNSEKHIAAAP